jgi:hypothetical protein
MIQPYVIKNIYYVVTTLQCNICPTITLTHGLSSYSETQGFFTNLSVVLSVEKWQMVVGDKTFGVVSNVLVGGSGCILPQKFFRIFPP